jgi:hypothetical protein
MLRDEAPIKMMVMTRGLSAPAIVEISITVMILACSEPPKPLPPVGHLPPNSFAFGVFGDAPYQRSEMPAFRRVLDDVNKSNVEWLIHVGDIQWFPCTDSAYKEKLDTMNTVDRAVIYTPGDNEWTDCYTYKEGGYPPLDRLASLRRIFFSHQTTSLGRHPIALESQAQDPAFAEFPENARWMRGGFVFATIHVVGSGNASTPFRGRTAANDAEVVRRERAAIVWLDSAFAKARAMSAKGVVIAMHANIYFENPPGETGPKRPYANLVGRLRKHTSGFGGEVLVIHGDSHMQRVDHPLTDSAGRAYANFTRLETFGAPEIGWVRVVVDSVAGRIAAYEPRRVR